jgi:hypothetical protein
VFGLYAELLRVFTFTAEVFSGTPLSSRLVHSEKRCKSDLMYTASAVKCKPDRCQLRQSRERAVWVRAENSAVCAGGV